MKNEFIIVQAFLHNKKLMKQTNWFFYLHWIFKRELFPKFELLLAEYCQI